MREILTKALDRIKPTKEEEKEVKSMVDIVLYKINKGLKDAKAVLGGSGIKGTWLKDEHDEDIFVCFDYKKYKDKSEKLTDILEKHLKNKFKLNRLHGSRDYFQIEVSGSTMEIVPILKIKNASHAENITDVSPLHANWVNKHKKYRDEIRLLKQFCKANNVYGAESHIKGFSGYICEILCIKYGSFENVLRNAVKWKDKALIDVEGYYKNKDVFKIMNLSKLQSPLIIIDPVQADRNAAAALSKEKLELFVAKAAKFIKKPSIDFFTKEEFSLEKLKQKAKNNEIIALKAVPVEGKPDVVGCKLLKAVGLLNQKLVRNGFGVIDYGFSWDEKKEAIIYLIVKKENLSKIKVHNGPPLAAKQHVETFKKMYKNTFIADGRINARVEREYTQARQMVATLIKEDYIKEKVKSIKFL